MSGDMSNKKENLFKQEKKKSLLFKFLVITLTLLIFSAWVIALKNSWQLQKNNQVVIPVANEIRKDVDETINEISERINKLEKQQQLEKGVENLINDLKVEFVKEPDFSNPQEASENFVIPEPLPINPIRNDCPAWINCMPIIDGPARPCVIPPGCEDYTQLAY